ncbi:MAG: class I SAM-dependent methyltransferase [Deltaproteobacteria bacterium]|nr:class I SAM-dependent methyltransferase [Deltaproteobacteria bacterium]
MTDQPPDNNRTYYHAYEERYIAVYRTGAQFWNPHEPSSALAEFLDAYNYSNQNVLELGCGEGFESFYLASRGLNVTAVDISPTVIEKCRALALERGVDINFQVGDMTQLDALAGESFELVVNVGSYHMLHQYEHRERCLQEINRLLVPGGRLFFQNGLNLKEAAVYFPEDSERIKAFKELRRNYRPGQPAPRRVVINGREETISLPVSPKTWFARLDEYTAEIEAAGFQVEQALRTNRDRINIGWEAVVVAGK